MLKHILFDDKELIKFIEKEAKINERTFSAQVRFILRKFKDKKEKEIEC